MEPRTDIGAAQDAALPVSPEMATEAQPQQRQVDYSQGKALMERCIRDAAQNDARLLRDRADIFNLKLDRGGVANHWSIWDPSAQRYVERGYDPDKGGIPQWVPRCVTNIFRVVINGITSILDQSEPAQVFAPKTNSDDDQAATDVAEDAVPVLREECGYDSEGHRHQLNQLAALTNGSIYCVYYDTDEKYGTEDIDVFTCTLCGEPATPLDIEEAGNKCPNPECSNSDTEAFELATQPDEMGVPKPVSVGMPVGRIRGEVIPSFEYSLPSSCRHANVKVAPWVLTHTRMGIDDVIRQWPEAKGIAKDKKSKAEGSLTRAYADQMRQLSSPEGSTSGGAKEFDGPVVYRLHHDPIDDDEFYFPDGFYGVMVGDQLIDKGPLPFKDADGRPFKNLILRTYLDGNGTQFGHPPADDLAPLQVTRNMVETMINLIIMTEASPTKYLPESVTLIDQPTGVPGEWVRYRSLVPGEKPIETRGMNPPESLFNYLDRIDAKFQEVSGLNSVLMGDRPSGDPTLGEVQILEERGMATFRAPLDSLIWFEKELSFMLLDVARQSAWSPRFRRIRGENRQWEIKAFSGADLRGQIDIQIDRASAWPKSPLMQQLRLREAVEMGVLNPQMDAELAGKMLVNMNLSDLKPSLDEDRRQVARELDIWKSAHTVEEILAVAPDPRVVELPIHIYLKKQFLKSEEAEELRQANPQLYEAMVAQVVGLEQAMAMKQMQQAAIAAGPQPAAPAPPGSSGELEQAIQSGALQPGAAQPQALDGAIQSGALVPGAPPEPGPQGPSIDDLLEAKVLQPVMPEGEASPPM